MKEKRNDLYSGIVFALFAVFLFVGSYWIPATTSDILGSRFFPRAIAVLVLILAAVQISVSLVQMKAQNPEHGLDKKKEGQEINTPLALTTAALFVYYVLILQVGFVITSILYLLFEGYVLMAEEDRKKKKNVIILVLVAVLVPVFLNTVFWNIFSIALPGGTLFNF
ncbi:MAG: hypothetical protein BACD_02295 [Bacteroides rodentium]